MGEYETDTAPKCGLCSGALQAATWAALEGADSFYAQQTHRALHRNCFDDVTPGDRPPNNNKTGER